MKLPAESVIGSRTLEGEIHGAVEACHFAQPNL
jgi:hypothetical protein